MSAYICDVDHIKALAIFAARRDGGYGSCSRNVEPCYLVNADARATATNGDAEIATYYAETLYQENIRSVRSRYPGDKWSELPGPIEKPLHIIVTIREMTTARRVEPVAILKAVSCLDYQSCETENYKETLGYQLLDMIRTAAIHALPGYEEASWDYTAA